MSKIDDGGPAFPRDGIAFPSDDGGVAIVVEPAFGMSLRDWFAGQALAGWMADPSSAPTLPASAKAIAHNCYLMADAMLAERLKEGGE